MPSRHQPWPERARRGLQESKIPALTFLTDVPDGSPPLLAWCGPVAPLLRGPLGLLEGVHLYQWLRELRSLGARPLWPRLGLARKVGVESACAVQGVVPWGDLGAVGALRRAWARALTISAPWNQLPCMFGVPADMLSDFLRLATGGRNKKKHCKQLNKNKLSKVEARLRQNEIRMQARPEKNLPQRCKR